MEREVRNLKELYAQAESFLGDLARRPQKDTATVVGLSGELGSGKTAFTKCVASALGVTETVTSPTFILEKIYSIPAGSVLGSRFATLVHIDAYRMDSAKEMRALNWEEIVLDQRNLVFIEWPEQVIGALPKDMIKVSFEYVNEGVRKILLN